MLPETFMNVYLYRCICREHINCPVLSHKICLILMGTEAVAHQTRRMATAELTGAI